MLIPKPTKTYKKKNKKSKIISLMNLDAEVLNKIYQIQSSQVDKKYIALPSTIYSSYAKVF